MIKSKHLPFMKHISSPSPSSILTAAQSSHLPLVFFGLLLKLKIMKLMERDLLLEKEAVRRKMVLPSVLKLQHQTKKKSFVSRCNWKQKHLCRKHIRTNRNWTQFEVGKFKIPIQLECWSIFMKNRNCWTHKLKKLKNSINPC